MTAAATVPAAELDHVAIAALRAGGMTADGATDVARVLVLADLFGIHAATLHDTPPADPDAPVQVPGEREMAAYRAALRDGVTIAGDDLAALRSLAAEAAT